MSFLSTLEQTLWRSDTRLERALLDATSAPITLPAPPRLPSPLWGGAGGGESRRMSRTDTQRNTPLPSPLPTRGRGSAPPEASS